MENIYGIICVYSGTLFICIVTVCYLCNRILIATKIQYSLAKPSFPWYPSLHILKDIWGSRLVCSFDFSNLHALCLCLKITLNNIFKLLMCEKAKLYLMNWFLHTFKNWIPLLFRNSTEIRRKTMFAEIIQYFQMETLWMPLMRRDYINFKS